MEMDFQHHFGEEVVINQLQAPPRRTAAVPGSPALAMLTPISLLVSKQPTPSLLADTSPSNTIVLGYWQASGSFPAASSFSRVGLRILPFCLELCHLFSLSPFHSAAWLASGMRERGGPFPASMLLVLASASMLLVPASDSILWAAPTPAPESDFHSTLDSFVPTPRRIPARPGFIPDVPTLSGLPSFIPAGRSSPDSPDFAPHPQLPLRAVPDGPDSGVPCLCLRLLPSRLSCLHLLSRSSSCGQPSPNSMFQGFGRPCRLQRSTPDDPTTSLRLSLPDSPQLPTRFSNSHRPPASASASYLRHGRSTEHKLSAKPPTAPPPCHPFSFLLFPPDSNNSNTRQQLTSPFDNGCRGIMKREIGGRKGKQATPTSTPWTSSQQLGPNSSSSLSLSPSFFLPFS